MNTPKGRRSCRGVLYAANKNSDSQAFARISLSSSRSNVASKLKREEGQLEWEMGAKEIDRRVRGLQPWPGATLPTARGRVKVLSGHLAGDRYVPDVVQLPGKKPAPAKQVLGDA